MDKRLIPLIAGAILLASGSAFAGPYQIDIMQHDQAVAAKKKAAQELAAKQSQESAGVAGAMGPEGKVGPGGKQAPAAKQPPVLRFHP